MACLACLSANPIGARAETELLKNPGFEQADVGGINDWDASVPFAVSSSTAVAAAGQRSVRIRSARDDFHPYLGQDVTQFARDQKYRLQYEVRTAKFGQEYCAYVGVWKGTNWLTGVDTPWRQGAEAWQKVAVDFALEGPAAAADRLQVVLQVKGPGTVWFDNVSLQPVVNEQPTAQPLPPFRGSGQFVQIATDRTFRVRGQPFFPIKIWGVRIETEEMLAAVRDFGFNVVTTGHAEALGPAGARLWLDMAEKHGLKVILTTRVEFSDRQAAEFLPGKLERLTAVINAIKTHPALLAFSLADEPAWSGNSLTAFAAGARAIRALDPHHPIYVNHAPRNTIAELRRYNQYADIAGSDIYPVWKDGLDHHSDLPNKTLSVVGDETTKNLAALDPHQPVIQTLQAFSWSDGYGAKDRSGDPFPTHFQLRFMGYDALVCGATGLAYYQDSRYRELRPELKPIIREFYALHDVLAAGPSLPVDRVCAQPGIKLLAKKHRGHLILIAVNRSAQPVEATFDLAGLLPKPPHVLPVLFEKRKLASRSFEFRDRFEPFAVHVYTDCRKETAILRPFVRLRVARQPTVDHQAKHDALVPRQGRNLALASAGAKVFASTELSHMKAHVVNDGDRWGSQWNDATAYEYPDWVALEFPRPTRLNKIAVFTRQTPIFGQWFCEGLRDYDVQIEQDQAWKTIHSVRHSRAFVEVIETEPVLTAKLRLWITATNGAGDYSRVMEIEAYGPD